MHKFIAILAVVLVAQASGLDTVTSMQQVQVKTLYDSVVNKEYNPNVRPYGVNGSDYVTYVYPKLVDVNILDVDETKGFFTFQAYARNEWVDPRLAYNDTTVSYIPVKECKSLWKPDTYFLNGVDVGTFPPNYHNLGKSSRFYPNGRVFSSYHLTQTIHCPALVKAAVGKEVICPVRVGSYGYFSDEVKFIETGITTINVKDVILPKFTFGGATPLPACDEGTAKLRTEEGGRTHTCIQANFKFTRV